MQITAAHKRAVDQYYKELATYQEQGVTHEAAIRSAFQNLLALFAPSVNCGAPISPSPTSAPDQVPPGAQPGYIPPYAQTPPQAQDDPFLAALAAGALASQMGQSAQPQARQRRRPLSTLSGCGCLLLALVVLAGPFVGVALTSGQLHRIFTYIAVGIVAFFLLIILIVMLATKKGEKRCLKSSLAASSAATADNRVGNTIDKNGQETSLAIHSTG